MSDTDIYKNREQMPYSNRGPKNARKRRRSSKESRAFDDHSRKRRSKNSGVRRWLHLYRKKDNEKVFWWVVLGGIVVIMVLLAVWQFGIREYMIRQQEQHDDYSQYQEPLPGVDNLSSAVGGTNSAAE